MTFQPVLLQIDTVTNGQTFEKWLITNRQRVFNLNPKHGENGSNAKANKGEVVSILLCNRDEAQQLLNVAKGDKRMNKEVYAFDLKHRKFIVFKDENTDINSYHGYHVDNENEVPIKIRERISTQ